MIGTTLSHFRIIAKIGEGGMGEVRHAEDTGEPFLVARDGGQQILLVRSLQDSPQNPNLMLVQNWYAEFSGSSDR